MPLLRMSTFCQSSMASKINVNLEITSRPQRNREVPGTAAASPGSVGWVTSDILIALSAAEGSCAWLYFSSSHSDTSDDAVHRVILRLYLLEEEENDDSWAFNDDENSEDDKSTGTILVAPIVATNLGLPCREILRQQSARDGTASSNWWIENIPDAKDVVQPAKHVTLRPLGRPADWPRSEVPFSYTHSHEVDAPNPNTSTHINDNNAYWIYPPQHSLLQLDHIISVYHSTHERICYYQVMNVLQTTDERGKDQCTQIRTCSRSSGAAFQSFSHTVFELDGTPLAGMNCVHRLPPLLPQWEYHRQTRQYAIEDRPSQLTIPPHPDLTELINAFDLQPAIYKSAYQTAPYDTSDPKTRILHVIGTEHEHDLVTAVETAAHQVGRTCWSLKGLAAFAHHASAIGRIEHTVRTGSLVDQLAGLSAALNEVRMQRMEPCVLHLYDFDEELLLAGDDLEQRYDQEERFWAKFLDGVAGTGNSGTPTILSKYCTDSGSSSSNSNSVPVSTAQNAIYRNQKYTCPLLIVISTKKGLQPGPLLEKFVFQPTIMTLPHEAYASYIWNKKSSSTVHQQRGADLSARDIFVDPAVLVGRPATDIRHIKRRVTLWEKGGSYTREEVMAHVNDLCVALDKKRRKKSSALVSDVHWEDIGGLDHVRSEIMDTIELPLRHPHLFAKTSGRSGILLYGPPGTGKTLVAKAVATECGLPFLSVKGPELLGSYVGESEANVRQIFKTAREAADQNAPTAACILFFDELDSLAPRRGGLGDGGGVMERVVATLFAELDGGNSRSGRIFVIGATNRPDLLDPNLLRPGRLDRLVYLGIQTEVKQRALILAAQMRKLRLDGDALKLSMEVVQNLPPRLTGADFSTIASGAARNAVRRLCRQADKEHEDLMKKTGESIGLDSVLDRWTEEMCTPVVQLEDLIEAAESVVPSVSEGDLEHYERLREMYGAKGREVTELEGDVFY